MQKNKKITVCKNCKRASCWQGEFYCEEYKTAGTIHLHADELKALNLEHESYWTGEPLPLSVSG